MYGVCSVDLPNSRNIGDSPALTIIYIISFLHVTWKEDKYIIELNFSQSEQESESFNRLAKAFAYCHQLVVRRIQLFGQWQTTEA